MNIQSIYKTAFDVWWRNVGSGMRPNPHDDYEQHARRVAEAAWEASSEYHSQAETSSDPMPLDHAKRLAGLWSAGKMIGGDPQAACIALLAEIERLEENTK
jgi:hypothetical protein